MKYPRWVKWEDFNRLVNKYGTWEVNRAISFCPVPQSDEEYRKILDEVERIAGRLRDDIMSYYLFQARPVAVHESEKSKVVPYQPEEEDNVCDACGGSLDSGWYEVQAVSWLNNRTLLKYLCFDCYHKIEGLLARR